MELKLYGVIQKSKNLKNILKYNFFIKTLFFKQLETT